MVLLNLKETIRKWTCGTFPWKCWMNMSKYSYIFKQMSWLLLILTENSTFWHNIDKFHLKYSSPWTYCKVLTYFIVIKVNLSLLKDKHMSPGPPLDGTSHKPILSMTTVHDFSFYTLNNLSFQRNNTEIYLTPGHISTPWLTGFCFNLMMTHHIEHEE